MMLTVHRETIDRSILAIMYRFITARCSLHLSGVGVVFLFRPWWKAPVCFVYIAFCLISVYTLLRDFCTIDNIRSSLGDTMVVEFRSDDTVHGRGFYLTYTTIMPAGDYKIRIIQMFPLIETFIKVFGPKILSAEHTYKWQFITYIGNDGCAQEVLDAPTPSKAN